ncbi:phage integrase family protein [Mycoplasmatota bacterium]|nr:phage integrase family protein [Mycoplasmatota bacterium]
MEFKEAINNHILFVEVTQSEGTLDFLKGKTGMILKYMGELDCEDIDKNTILKFISEQRKRNPSISNATLNKYIQLIRKVLKTQCDIIIKFEKLKEVKKIIKVIPQDIVLQILNHFKKTITNKHSHRNYVYFRLLLETGLRFREATNVLINNVDFHNNVILVEETKTKAERYVFFSNELKSYIMDLIIKNNLKGYLFTDFKGNQLSYLAVTSILKRARKRLKIPKEISISNHKWRHTFATNFTKSGGNLEVLRQILGHTSIETTQKYIHLDKDYLSLAYNQTMQNHLLKTQIIG